jgi:hypothetical protein
MYTQNIRTSLVAALAPRLAAGVLASLALLSSSCGGALDTQSNLSALTSLGLSTPGESAAVPGFPILANAAATCTNGNIGSVGTFLEAPFGAITLPSCTVTGTVHVGDAQSKAAYTSFLAAYLALAPSASDDCTVLTGTLAGRTLAPGNYCFDAAATLTGILTLDGPASGIWIFKIGTIGTGALTATNASVVMAGGGQNCNVTWRVAQGATITTSSFQGNILAGAAITMTGNSLNGNAWAKADVTNTGTVVTGCAPVSNGDDGSIGGVVNNRHVDGK